MAESLNRYKCHTCCTQVAPATADVLTMPQRHATLSSTQAPTLDEAHWRAAAEEGARLAAKQWQVPLANITEVALSDADGPHYLFKVIYTDRHGRRLVAAVRMPKNTPYSSPLAMSALFSGSFASR